MLVACSGMTCGASLEVTAIAQREANVDVTDHADADIRVLPILPREQTDATIRDHLRERGWSEEPDGSLHKESDGAIAVLPPGSNTVRVTLSDETTVSVKASSTGRVRTTVDADRAAIDARAAAKADAALAAAEASAKRQLEAATADRLLKVWTEVRAELDEVANAVTKQTLQQRAAELGTVESETEHTGDNGYEITIQVRT